MIECFQFEADFAASLRCIPMPVRYKLDSCGVKLKLQHWNQLSVAERQQLLAQSCTSPAERAAYRQQLQAWVVRDTGAPATEFAVAPQPPWEVTTALPAAVQAKLQELGQVITLSQWESLSPLQRFALLKLSRPSHENRNFLPALREFGLL